MAENKDDNNEQIIEFMKRPDIARFWYMCAFANKFDAPRSNPKPGWMDANIYTIEKTADLRQARPEYLSWLVQNKPFTLSHTTLRCCKQKFDNYQVSHIPEVESTYAQLPGKIGYLYHGSPTTNWHSIMFNGIRVMSGTSEMTNGAVHGDGIYLSDDINLSYQYCAPNDNKGHDIIIGVYEVRDPEQYRKLRSIHVIPSQDLLILRYLIHLPKQPSKALGPSFNQTLEQRANNREKSHKKRLRKMQKCVEKHWHTVVEHRDKFESLSYNDKDIPYTIQIGGILVTFPHDYPFRPYTIDGKLALQLDPEKSLVQQLLELNALP